MRRNLIVRHWRNLAHCELLVKDRCTWEKCMWFIIHMGEVMGECINIMNKYKPIEFHCCCKRLPTMRKYHPKDYLWMLVRG